MQQCHRREEHVKIKTGQSVSSGKHPILSVYANKPPQCFSPHSKIESQNRH